MKSMTMLVAATAVLLAVNTSGARSQEACTNFYVSCMDACAAKPLKSVQGGCMEACQAKNDQCAEKIFGVRREPVGRTRQAGEAKDALAKDAAPVSRPPQAEAPAPEAAPSRK
jgi:hypothetical protein